MRQRRFVSPNYPVEERRHLLELGTLWVSGVGNLRVRLVLVHPEEGEVTLAKARPGTPQYAMPPGAIRLDTERFLRNYRRTDEE